ncbi:hypothetical protein ASG43_14575 [Aureimonas sp. Leaf454]|uniref:FAD-dependent monooxygenase n=1 Tax=Aureimonas sp. Leaf454 TaxID=1736381 RepID=UPI0006F75858|nr:FAD-dependent monooxygenase [Aureimonas sp. Leaf454]KQT44548.1 hypothetical protein ASG43_14575 [Aureimonas sp. Leaf454]
MTKIVDTDVLIVGAGPAGAAASVLLGRAGISNIMLSRYRGPADSPRAHVKNQRAMEVMRDVGLEEECLAKGAPADQIAHTFWLNSMSGEELARAWSWGNDPARIGEYIASSPCSIIDLPQTDLEPILVGEATRLGAHVRFGWDFQSFTQDESGVTAQIVDRLSEAPITVRAKYMIGADGARSKIVQQLGLPLAGHQVVGDVFSVFCEIDLSRYVSDRPGSLFNVVDPDGDPDLPVAVYRMVRPWNEWLVTLIAPLGRQMEPTLADFERRIRQTVKDDSLPLNILSSSKWQVNDINAERYSEGRVFCIGDAVHRHPPANALGSNTCVQDAFNLAWKLALVIKGRADAKLLDSFNAERQPVGAQIVARANQSFRMNAMMWDTFGAGIVSQKTPEERDAVFDTPEGRAKLHDTLDTAMPQMWHGHGVEMTRRYESDAIVPDGTPEEEPVGDPEVYHRPSARPGAVVPHAWLVKRTPGPRVSTLDLAGKNRFHLFIGHGGDAWREAATAASARLGIDIGVTAIGHRLDYEDPYGTWRSISAIAEDGCVLVRPDLIVGWRSHSLPDDPATALDGVMNHILGYAA